MRTICGVILVGIAAVASAPARAETDTPIVLAQAEKRPANLVKYSHRYWPRNALRKNQTVSADTPFGRLTCRGVSWNNGGRECSLSGK
jgi:hypothetical protein